MCSSTALHPETPYLPLTLFPMVTQLSSSSVSRWRRWCVACTDAQPDTGRPAHTVSLLPTADRGTAPVGVRPAQDPSPTLTDWACAVCPTKGHDYLDWILNTSGIYLRITFISNLDFTFPVWPGLTGLPLGSEVNHYFHFIIWHLHANLYIAIGKINQS